MSDRTNSRSRGDERCAWVHAHLHRARGEESNTGYWYRRAGKPSARGSPREEWDEIVAALLSRRTVGGDEKR